MINNSFNNLHFCKYKNIFGYPKEGIHSYRIYDIAIADVIMTLIVGYIISYYFKLSLKITCIVLFSLGIILHRMFCVKTTIDKLLFS